MAPLYNSVYGIGRAGAPCGMDRPGGLSYNRSMSRTLVLSLSDEAYEELARVSSEERLAPELVASKILNDLLPDPLLRLSGAIQSPVADAGIHHDEYIGEGVHSSDTR